jgi:hypothetical protein
MPDRLKETHNATKKVRAYKKHPCNSGQIPTETNGMSPNNHKGEQRFIHNL